MNSILHTFKIYVVNISNDKADIYEKNIFLNSLRYETIDAN